MIRRVIVADTAAELDGMYAPDVQRADVVIVLSDLEAKVSAPYYRTLRRQIQDALDTLYDYRVAQ